MNLDNLITTYTRRVADMTTESTPIEDRLLQRCRLFWSHGDNLDEMAAHVEEAAWALRERGWAIRRLCDDIQSTNVLIKRLYALVAELQSYGCPICGGDCVAANPPVTSCPMRKEQ